MKNYKICINYKYTAVLILLLFYSKSELCMQNNYKIGIIKSLTTTNS